MQPTGASGKDFQQALPGPQSDLAQPILKDPYTFDFLTLSADTDERDLDRALVDQIRQFLLELGIGFSFVGSQCALGANW